MRQPKQIKEELSIVGTLKDLCLSYEEISVMKMRKIRSFVLQTREFYSNLSQVYYNVKRSYKDTIEILEKKRRFKKAVPINLSNKLKKFFHKGVGKDTNEPRQKDSIVVLLSANTKLHGSIIDEIFTLFSQSVVSDDSDIMIVGKLGRDFYNSLPPPIGGRNYLYFEIPDFQFDLEDLKAIVYHLRQYKKITVFYGQYETMMKQSATHTNVTGDMPDEVDFGTQQKKDRFIFEPSLPSVLDFFESQIFSALFKQTMHESELARFASRIQAMEQALTSIEGEQKKLYTESRRIRDLVENKKQQGRIAGMSLWGKRL